MNTMTLTIDGRTVGHDAPALVVAEIGVNHDGDVGRALELVAAAHEAGADAIKLQAFCADRLAGGAGHAPRAAYQGAGDQASLLRGLELSAAQVERVTDAARALGVIPIVTPFSPEDVQLVAYLGLPAVKLASPDLVNDVLVRAVAEVGVPMLLSTGAATADEVGRQVGLLDDLEAEYALLHCVSSYPVADADATLCWIEALERFGVPVGYSDHTAHPDAGALAVAAGACVVEKHLTYDRNAAGPDHAASFTPLQLADYVRRIRTAEGLLGRGLGGKRVQGCEADVRRVSRQSLVMRHDVAPGRVITYDDLTTRRPGDGIPAGMVHEIVGRVAASALTAGEPLCWSQVRHATAAQDAA